MTAETLRNAASLIRERAEAAIRARQECDGEKHGGPSARYSSLFLENAIASHAPGDSADAELRTVWRADAEHLDGWQDPAVALAVADMLDALASPARFETAAPLQGAIKDALAVANAYLGGEQR